MGETLYQRRRNLRNDFITLQNQEYNAVYVLSLCKNVDNILAVFNNYVDHINDLAGKNSVPESAKYLDFSETLGSKVQKIVNENSDSVQELTNICKEIDEIKGKIGAELETVNAQIKQNESKGFFSSGGGGGGAYYISDAIGNGLPGIFHK